MQELATGKPVKDERGKRGWSQQALASKADISLRTLVRIEQGEDCNVSTMRKIAAALELPLVDLIGEQALRKAHGLCLECEVTTFGKCEHRPAAVAS